MASVGGRFSRSVERGSDAIYDFSCSPCEIDGRHEEALHGCVECGENLCSKCLRDHNKFQGMRGHKILDKEEMRTRGPQASPVLIKEKCKVHGTEVVNMYCGNHDVVSCGVCIALNHRSCEDVDFIPNVATGIKASKQVKDVVDGLNKIKLDLNVAKKQKQEDLKRIGREMSKSLTDIDQFRDKIVSHLDEMVKKAKAEVQAQYAELLKAINIRTQQLGDMITSLDDNVNHVESSKRDSEAHVFLYVKQGKRNAVDGSKLLSEMATETERLNYSINSDITAYVMNLKSIGGIRAKEEKPRIQGEDIRPISSAFFHKQYNVKVSGDKKTCDIQGIGRMDDGSVVISDSDNNKLKLLNSALQLMDSCTVPSEPWGVCSTGPTEAAVALPDDRKIQFISTGDKLSLSGYKLSLTRSFQVGVLCNYVAVNKGELFVTCADQVRVYSLAGKHLRTFQNDTSGQPMFCTLMCIAVSNDGTNIHVTDGYTGVVTVDRQGHRQSTFTDPSLKSAFGVCELENNNLLVSGWGSHNVIQIGSDGRMIGNILSKADGIKKPQSLFYDKVNSRLIVTMERTDHIKVFGLLRK